MNFWHRLLDALIPFYGIWFHRRELKRLDALQARLIEDAEKRAEAKFLEN